MKTYTLYTLILLLSMYGLSSCVTAKRYDDMAARARQAEISKAECDEKIALMEEDKKRAETQIQSLNSTMAKLREDSVRTQELYTKNKVLLDDLFDKYDRLNKSYNNLLSNSAAEAGTLSKNLSEKERELLALEQNLLANKAQVDKLSADLSAREKKLGELEQILKEKDQAVNDLRDKVNKALLGFKDSGLTVDVRNGKVYVSLAEKLLFKSGSYAIDPKGIEALTRLAGALKDQQDINVMVEGHTDDVPVSKGNACIDDNWDLSVLRATSIVNTLVSKGVTPSRLVAAGKGEFAPVEAAKTAEARQRNRRTEIILTPKLDELFQILDVN
jgi:chemotaxis protein MotB